MPGFHPLQVQKLHICQWMWSDVAGHKGSSSTTTSIPRNFANISRELLRSEITTISPLVYKRHTVAQPLGWIQKNSNTKIIFLMTFQSFLFQNLANWIKVIILLDLPHCATLKNSSEHSREIQVNTIPPWIFAFWLCKSKTALQPNSYYYN